ncbi:hypothetical protein KQH49_15045, partial [Mycetohabitans sp. B5]
LSGLSDAAQEAECARFLQEAKAVRFDPAQPPLLRFSLIQLATHRYRGVLTFHHILLDGWSMPMLLQELIALYADGGNERALPRVAPYRDYLAWLKGHDCSAAEQAWREALAGLEEPTRLASIRATSPMAQEMVTWTLPETLANALNGQARQRRVTLNTLMQAAWGLLLSHLTARDDVVFGVTVSGRPPELPGVERMIGLLINTLPLRVRSSPTQSIADLLTQVQDQQTRLLENQHLSLTDIQHFAGLGELFDTLMVFENYPFDRQTMQTAPDTLQLTGVEGNDATHYPLSLTVIPGVQLACRLGYRPDLFDRYAIERLMRRFNCLLEAIAQDPEQPIGGIELLEAAERQQLLVEWNATERA